MKYERLAHRFVDDMPEQLEPGHLYVSVRYATAMHLCACGCGREVVTPLSPAQWKMTFDGETVSLSPSIGSWALPCRSHYLITRDKVIDAPRWSEDEVAKGHARDRRKRTEHYTAKSTPPAPVPVLPPEKIGWFDQVKSLFGFK
jgi:hypothetical protein